MTRLRVFRAPGGALAAALLGVLIATASPRSGTAQPPVAVGTRVRVYAPSMRHDRYSGRIDVMQGDSMVLDTAGASRRLGFDVGPVLVEEYRRVTIPLSAIEAIEVSRGVAHRRSTIRGAIIGGLVLGVLIGASSAPEVNPHLSDMAGGFAVGAVAGGLVGGGVGYMLGSEKWAPAARPRAP